MEGNVINTTDFVIKNMLSNENSRQDNKTKSLRVRRQQFANTCTAAAHVERGLLQIKLLFSILQRLALG